MVVAYRMGALTASAHPRFNLVKSAFFAQPNLLGGRRIVSEYFNEQAVGRPRPGTHRATRAADRTGSMQTFAASMHEPQRDASARAAEAITQLQ